MATLLGCMPPLNSSSHVGKHSGRPEEDAVMAAGQKCGPGCLSYQHQYSSQNIYEKLPRTFINKMTIKVHFQSCRKAVLKDVDSEFCKVSEA